MEVACATLKVRMQNPNFHCIDDLTSNGHKSLILNSNWVVQIKALDFHFPMKKFSFKNYLWFKSFN